MTIQDNIAFAVLCLRNLCIVMDTCIGIMILWGWLEMKREEAEQKRAALRVAIRKRVGLPPAFLL